MCLCCALSRTRDNGDARLNVEFAVGSALALEASWSASGSSDRTHGMPRNKEEMGASTRFSLSHNRSYECDFGHAYVSSKGSCRNNFRGAERRGAPLPSREDEA